MSIRPDIPLGHTIPAHQTFGWCSHCPDRTPAEELAAWQTRELRRMAAEAQPAQPQASEAPISRAHIVAYSGDGTTKCVDDCPECAAQS
jgi:hypothetical protein